MLNRTRWSSRAPCAPLDDRRRRRENERSARPEEGGTRERAHGADRDRASVVHLDRERLPEADEHDERDQRKVVVAGAEDDAEHARRDADEGDEAHEERQPAREREEPRAVDGVRPRMAPLFRRDQLDGRRQGLEVVARLRDRDEPRLAVDRDGQRLGRRVEDAVSPLELGPVDGEVGLVDELVRVLAVARVGSDADRDRRPDRLARRLDVERALGDLAPDPLGDLERLLRAGLRKENAELLAAEARRHVVVAQLRAEDLGDALEHGIAGEVAVRVVDVAQEVEVGHDQRQRAPEALGAHDLLVQGEPEMACVEEPGLRVDARFRLELWHGERAVNQEHRGDRERDQPRIRVPERREHDTERREHELGREPVEGEEARLTDRVPVAEEQHRGEHRVVQPDEDERAGRSRDSEA